MNEKETSVKEPDDGAKPVPRHLGIICDGNRRWAKEHGLTSFQGHKAGLENFETIAKACQDRGIKILTLFVFSTENWNRSKEEVDYLMKIANTAIGEHAETLGKHNIKVQVIGQRNRLPQFLQESIAKTEELTKDNTGLVINFALSYGGRTELVEAFKNMARKGINPDDITEETIKENLWTSDVDLIIRTGKEQRISNFLIWQAAYSEFYFSQKYWPEFTPEVLDEILADYANRQRRFGK